MITSIGYYVSDTGGAAKPFTIPAGQMLFELITSGRVYTPSGKELKGPGYVFCHRPGDKTIWQTEEEEHYECLTLLFDAALVHPGEDWPRFFFWGEGEEAITFAHEMITAFHHTEVPADILGNLVWSILRFRLNAFRRQEVRREIPPRISMVMNYIDRYYAQDIGIEELAAHVSLSPSHLHARFREFVGKTPHQYLIEQRMRVARHRLVTTADPIKAISHSIGYVNAENFSRAFKRRFKSTAAAYRRRYTLLPS